MSMTISSTPVSVLTHFYLSRRDPGSSALNPQISPDLVLINLSVKGLAAGTDAVLLGPSWIPTYYTSTGSLKDFKLMSVHVLPQSISVEADCRELFWPGQALICANYFKTRAPWAYLAALK